MAPTKAKRITRKPKILGSVNYTGAKFIKPTRRMRIERVFMATVFFLFLLGLSFAAISGFASVLRAGIQLHERSECERWVQQSKEYTMWYATAWQIGQCREYGIELIPKGEGKQIWPLK